MFIRLTWSWRWNQQHERVFNPPEVSDSIKQLISHPKNKDILASLLSPGGQGSENKGGGIDQRDRSPPSVRRF